MPDAVLTEEPGLDEKTFEAFRKIIYDHSGINLGPQKATLVRSRIAKRLRALGLSTHKEYLERVKADPTGEELVQLIDVISTNVTSFFREAPHFDILASLINDRVAAGARRIRIWSAACSSGEEPYSIALTALTRCELAGADLKILATDISTPVLKRCHHGIFREESLKPVPGDHRLRFFSRTGEEDSRGPLWQAGETLRRLITVRRINLSQPPFPMQGPFDCVFCRNVMIYFDATVRRRLLDEILRLMPSGGLLFVGHAESLTGLHRGLKCVRPSVYVKE